MNLFYWRSESGNVGDDLNPWLFSKLVPDLLDADSSNLLVGIGTILDERIPAEPVKYIFGSGVRYPNRVTRDESWKIYALRGPLSARQLGVSPKKAIADPAILVADHYSKPGLAHLPFAVYVPYFRSAKSQVWQRVCRDANLHYLDPCIGVEPFLEVISRAKLVITEAMHGAIIADAFRVPWIPVRSFSQKHEGETNNFKWSDWCLSMDLPYRPEQLPCIWPDQKYDSLKSRVTIGCKEFLLRKKLDLLVRQGIQCLSSDQLFRARSAQLYEALDKMRKDVNSSERRLRMEFQ